MAKSFNIGGVDQATEKHEAAGDYTAQEEFTIPNNETEKQFGSTGFDVNMFRNTLALRSQRTPIGEEGTRFQEELFKALRETRYNNENIAVTQITAEAPLDHDGNTYLVPHCYAVVINKLVFLLVFSEGQHISSDKAINALIGAARCNTAKQLGPDHMIINSMIVFRRDYNKMEQLLNLILNQFEDVLSGAYNGMSVDLLNSMVYSVDTNLDNVLNQLEHDLPQTFVPRVDFGLRLIGHDRNDGRRRRVDTPSTIQESSDRIIGTVGAFAELQKQENVFTRLHDGSVGPRFLPVIRITVTRTLMNHPGVTTALLAVAEEYFVRREMWLDQFGVAKDEDNLANLLQGPDGAPINMNNLEERRQFADVYCEKPILALDVIDGLAMPIATTDFAESSNNHNFAVSLADRLSTFFGVAFTPRIADRVIEEYTAAINEDGKLADSRDKDYFELVRRFNSAADVVKLGRVMLDHYEGGEQERVNFLRECGYSIEHLFETRTVILSRELLDTAAHVISRLHFERSEAISGKVSYFSGIDASSLSGMAGPRIGGLTSHSNQFSGAWGGYKYGYR